MIFPLTSIFLTIATISALPTTTFTGQNSTICPPLDFSTVPDFQILSYLGKWYVQEQQETRFVTKERNFCVNAEYTLLDKKTIKVYNSAKNGSVTGTTVGGELRGIIKDETIPSKLSVGPITLPDNLKGPYWVVYTSPINTITGLYDAAIIVAGLPTFENQANGLCSATNENPFNGNGEGLWLFTREEVASDHTVAELRAKATVLGLDVSILNKVEQIGC